MPQTPFHAYYKARLLEQLPEAEQFLPVFASSDIEIYPFQIAAASFALRSPYQKGAVLCDEAGMGKSHEAMLVINQKWLEGYSRILLVIPNADLLHQWTEMLERFYTVPYVVLTNRDQWRQNTSEDNSNAFMQKLMRLPSWLLRLVVKILFKLDRKGKVPYDLIRTDPNYASIFLTNLGSIGLDAGYHHLNNWGTNSFFGVIGKKHLAPEWHEDGSCTVHPVLDLGLTLDERIGDGFYYSGTVRLLRKLLENPELLEQPFSTEVEY